MFYYLDGIVSIIEPNLVVIDVGGVGYGCFATMNTISYLEKGKKTRLYTYCNVKEDAFDVYGFHDMSEKRCFEMLIGVSGVGPKAALAILSSVTPENLMMAILTENEKALTAAPGIGKKIAQRIILELKDKAAKEGTSFGSAPASGSVIPAVVSGNKLNEVTAALSVLGYSQAEITAGIKSLDVDKMSVEEIIRAVLKGSLK